MLYHCPTEPDYTKITTVLLKSRTGEFDVESILFLKLKSLGKGFYYKNRLTKVIFV